jgi:hypothetical protein
MQSGNCVQHLCFAHTSHLYTSYDFQNTAIVSLNGISWQVMMGTWVLLWGRNWSLFLIHQSLTTNARVRSRVSPFEICDKQSRTGTVSCGGQRGTGIGFLLVVWFSTVVIIPAMLQIYLQVNITYQKDERAKSGNLQQSNVLRGSGGHRQRRIFTFFRTSKF